MSLRNVEERSDWPYICDGAVTLFHEQSILDAAIEAICDEGYAVHQIDCGSEASMMRDFASALRWVYHFGYDPDRLNLDALNDAFRSEPSEEYPRLTLVLNRYPELQTWNEKAARAILDIIEFQSRDHLLFDRRLVAFVRTDNPSLHIDGLGSRAAHWNYKEWPQ